MFQVIIRSIVPIVILLGLGLFSRHKKIMKPGDEKVFGAYLYYFALPALLFINITETEFTGQTLKFIFSGMLPALIVLAVYITVFFTAKLKKDNLYLLMLTTFFGNFVFFGVPFIMFVFPGGEGERLAILSSAFISVLSVFISVTALELSKVSGQGIIGTLKIVSKQLMANPLVFSIIAGLAFSLVGLRLPRVFSTALHMLGGTTATVAFFMLGAFIYGRKYTGFFSAFKLALPRIVLLPAIAFFVTRFLGLGKIESAVIILMNAMPLAIAVSVMSDRYDFHKETVATLILVSSIGSIIYLPIWIYILGIQ
ncbi:MAG: hypothetical protein A2297_02330 [Elusimicrobia bacterium RIFOXYB2_FULL_48_7]|nr:MAG: hypothetical protein A2297_02330 [Elusimicrobia bacterium RIFOXYB2_FULL_48_7]